MSIAKMSIGCLILLVVVLPTVLITILTIIIPSICDFFNNRPKLGRETWNNHYIINSKYSAFVSSYAISKNKWKLLEYYPIYNYEYGLRFNVIDSIRYRIFYNKFKNQEKRNQKIDLQRDDLKHQVNFIKSLQKDINDYERKNINEIKNKYNNIWDNRELILKTKHPVKLYSPEEFNKINWFNKMHNIGDIVGVHYGSYIDFYIITEYEGKESYLSFFSRSEFTCFKVG